MEVQYQLLSYGIPLVALPIDSGGKCSNDFQKIWVEQRREIELQQYAHLTQKAPATGTKTSVAMMNESNAVVIEQPMSRDSEDVGNGGLLSAHSRDAAVGCIPSSSISLQDPADGPLGSSRQPQSLSIPPQVPSSATPGKNSSDRGSQSNNNVIDVDGNILLPQDNDILLGRGRTIDQHPGNVQFRKYLQQDAFLQHYQKAKRCGKGQLADCIQKKLRTECNVRFLVEDADSGRGWVVASAPTVREKILRTLRRLVLSQNKESSSQVKGAEAKNKQKGKGPSMEQ